MRSPVAMGARMVWVTLLTVGAVFGAVAGCSSEDSASGDPESAEGIDGPVLRHSLPFATEGEDAAVGGVVEIDGDCLYLVNDNIGMRVSVVWPATTSWDAESRLVRLANGESVGVGDRVLGGGGYRHVERVRLIVGDAVADRAQGCGDGTSEVAVVNNQPDAIRLG